MELLEQVRQTIRRYDLARADTRVVVALSGGPDSVALSHFLLALEATGELRVGGFAHFNHQLRADADADERFCEALAAALGRPMLVGRADVAALAAQEHRSIEDAAHHARHEFLARARAHFEADVIAVGHTRDDQAETFLLRLLRGAGSRGLAAMHPRHGAIVRPLIDCRRAQLRADLEARAIPYVSDRSNDDLRVPRNRVRAELIPRLQEHFNPSIVDVLADEAAVAQEEWRWLDAAASEAAARLCRFADLVCRIDAEALNALPVAVGRLVARRALTAGAGERPISFDHVETLLRLSRGGGMPIDLPGQRMERVGSDVVLTGRRKGDRGRSDSAAAPTPNLFRYPLSIPGEVWIAEAGGLLSAEVAAQQPRAGAGVGSHRGGPGEDVAVVQFPPHPGPLAVRNRRPGDRFRPLGLGGTKKVQDYFVDRKVARNLRDSVPLVVDAADRIVWVAGHAIDERFRVIDPAQAVVVLRLRQV